MHVVLRIRPLLTSDKNQNNYLNQFHGGFSDVRTIVSSATNSVIFNPILDLETKKRAKEDPNKNLEFNFDKVFSEDATQTEVYQSTAKKFVKYLISGINGSIFTYGATGCGKTHTLFGNKQEYGIVQLFAKELFDRIAELSDEVSVQVSLSYLEVYNEQLRDLLYEGKPSNAPKLTIADAGKKGNKVINLSINDPYSFQELLDMINRGNSKRETHPSFANSTSSRSHAVLQIGIRITPLGLEHSKESMVSTMTFTDLAGSERASVSTNNKKRFKEGANINCSLLALGSCIKALSQKARFIPFRNSILTRLLKPSLQGNCRTLMVVCVSPAKAYREETFNTLKYAKTARGIKNKATKNMLTAIDDGPDPYMRIKELRNKIALAEKKLKELSTETKNEPIVDYKDSPWIVTNDPKYKEFGGISKKQALIEVQNHFINLLCTKRDIISHWINESNLLSFEENSDEFKRILMDRLDMINNKLRDLDDELNELKNSNESEDDEDNKDDLDYDRIKKFIMESLSYSTLNEFEVSNPFIDFNKSNEFANYFDYILKNPESVDDIYNDFVDLYFPSIGSLLAGVDELLKQCERKNCDPILVGDFKDDGLNLFNKTIESLRQLIEMSRQPVNQYIDRSKEDKANELLNELIDTNKKYLESNRTTYNLVNTPHMITNNNNAIPMDPNPSSSHLNMIKRKRNITLEENGEGHLPNLSPKLRRITGTNSSS